MPTIVYKKSANRRICTLFLREKSNLPLHAFVFVIKLVVRARSCVSPEKFYHLVLVEIDRTTVCVGIFVIFIIFATLAVCRVFYPIF